MNLPYTTSCRPEDKAHFFASHQRTCYCGAQTVPDRNNKDLYGGNCFLFTKGNQRARKPGRRKDVLEVSTDVVEREQEASLLEEWHVKKDRDLLKHIGLAGADLDEALKGET